MATVAAIEMGMTDQFVILFRFHRNSNLNTLIGLSAPWY